MHARKDRRILEEKRHGGCASGRERTAAQRETVSGRKGPQARAIAFSGHNPRRTRRAQHGIFGERSFRRLRYLAWDWTQYLIRPDRFGWPVIRKPLHGALETNSPYVTTFANLLEALASREDLRRHTRLRSASKTAVEVGKRDQLFS